MDDSLQTLVDECARHSVWILYTPLPGEVDIQKSPLGQSMPSDVFFLPNRHYGAPEVTAQALVQTYAGKTGSVFIPGTLFDEKGNRKGRGGGWYDRFLPQLPKDWVRVGCLPEKLLSPTPLIPESWDQPMDWLLIETAKGYRTLQTEARG